MQVVLTISMWDPYGISGSLSYTWSEADGTARILPPEEAGWKLRRLRLSLGSTVQQGDQGLLHRGR